MAGEGLSCPTGLFWRCGARQRGHEGLGDVAGAFDAAQLVYDYIEADGIWLPSKRRAYTRGEHLRPNLDPLMVSIDISNVRFT